MMCVPEFERSEWCVFQKTHLVPYTKSDNISSFYHYLIILYYFRVYFFSEM